MTTFKELDLHPQVLKALDAQGYETPTPIQAQAIPHLMQGRDLLGIAQTGTGKTAAFALPTLDFLLEEPKYRRPKTAHVLVLAPTRELVSQIAESFRNYSKHMDCNVQTVFGGVRINQQIRSLQKGVHVLVATPGRLNDLMGQGAVKLDDVDVLILDEADQMLDMGFIHDLKKIIDKVPSERQTLLFSATMPKQIAELTRQYLRDPVKVSVTPESTTAERVDQSVLHVATENKPQVLLSLLKDQTIDRALVFTRTKHGADKVVRKLSASGVDARAIHGNKTQPQRMKALEAFKRGDCNVLIATDIAARGIDIQGISHVINYELPNVPEQYVHRIGRTARAGKSGMAISLVAADELYYLREIETITRVQMENHDTPEDCAEIILPTPSRKAPVQKPKGPSQNRGGRRPSSGDRPSRKPTAKKTTGSRTQKHRKPSKSKAANG